VKSCAADWLDGLNPSQELKAKWGAHKEHGRIKATRQIGVILYAKGALHGAPAPADELPIQDILTVKHDVIPLDGADVFQQGSIDSIGDRVALAEDSGDLPRLPVDNARQDQVQTAAGVHGV
jgi:hypothetical protein